MPLLKMEFSATTTQRMLNGKVIESDNVLIYHNYPFVDEFFFYNQLTAKCNFLSLVHLSHYFILHNKL